jgi:hypothetical protein
MKGQSHFSRADGLLENFATNDKFSKRYEAITSSMETFIDKMGYSNNVNVNSLILCYALLDYYEDIRRLKEFHKMEHISSVKKVAYISYWLLLRKPLQINNEIDRELVFVNERFLLVYILDFLSNAGIHPVLLDERDALTTFKEDLFYFLKYRVISAQSLEMLLSAFFAGRVYQDDGDKSRLIDDFSYDSSSDS